MDSRGSRTVAGAAAGAVFQAAEVETTQVIVRVMGRPHVPEPQVACSSQAGDTRTRGAEHFAESAAAQHQVECSAMNWVIAPSVRLTFVLACGFSAALGDDTKKNAESADVLPAGQAPAKAVKRALTFLAEDARKWRTDRSCATCHHGIMTIWALSEAKSQGYPVDAEMQVDMLQWTKDRFQPRSLGTQGPQPGSVSVPMIYLGVMSQNLPILSRDEINRIALYLAARQDEEGTWESPPQKTARRQGKGLGPARPARPATGAGERSGCRP